MKAEKLELNWLYVQIQYYKAVGWTANAKIFSITDFLQKEICDA